MRTLLAMAWRNVLRNRRRSLLTAAAMSVAVAICMTMMALTAGMYGQMGDALVTRTLGHVQVHDPDWPGKRQVFDALDDADARLATLRALPEVATATQRLIGNALVGGATKTEGAQLLGVDPVGEDAIRHASEHLTAGTWLPSAADHRAVLGVELADKLGVGVGDEVVVVTQAADGSLGNDLYTVCGLLHTGAPAVDRGTAFLHIDDLRDLLAMPDRAHELVVLAPDDDRATIEATDAAVAAALHGDDVLVRPWWVIDPATEQLLGMQTFSALIMITFFFGVSAIGVVNTLLMSVFERTRELGVMRAVGMRPRQLVALVMLEALVLAVLAVALGTAVGFAGDAWLVQHGIDLSIDGQGYAMGEMTFDPVIRGQITAESVWQPVVGVFLFSMIAAIWPALRAARLRPVDALREG
ncbi:MAG: ABC transporter permease [Alphaproteobacteria bacterium]|nr:ABC transporter permease [Alphaproteobacteria bacterium]